MAGELLDDRSAAMSLEAKVWALKQPATYPEVPAALEVIETHMSCVFLTPRHAYKLKKPVRYDYLDFSSLAARWRNCQEEVRLNRRLAPDVYLGVVPLGIDRAGRLRLEDTGGEVVEWLVKMRRLPAQRMLEHMITQGTLRALDVRPAAEVLARFYERCSPIPIDPQRRRAELEADVRYNLRELSRPVYGLPTEQITRMHQAQLGLLRDASALFDERVAAGRIVEGHGDLRPGHICLEPAPVIFDCLEFNRDFRILDPADELAFLAMECERLGADFVGREFFAVYRQLTGDDPPATIVAFHKAARACLRARLAIWHTHELEKREWPKWQELAKSYLDLAASYNC